MRKEKTQKVLKVALFVALIVALFAGASYAFIQLTLVGEKKYTIEQNG